MDQLCNPHVYYNHFSCLFFDMKIRSTQLIMMDGNGPVALVKRLLFT